MKMRVYIPVFLILFFGCMGFTGGAQSSAELLRKEYLSNPELDNQEILPDVIRHDLSVLFTNTPAAGIFGFIGEDRQRIHIKFISVIRDHADPSTYFVYGKSMVKNNVCDFQGTLVMTGAYRWRQSDVPDFQQGIVLGTYRLFENPRQKHTGAFKGSFVSNWYIDRGGVLHYDDLAQVADDFSNNQFAGVWTSYTGRSAKPCHWGDWRIPLSGDLDTGAGEFFPDDKYHDKGWRTYVDAHSENPDAAAAKAKEIAEWWKD